MNRDKVIEEIQEKDLVELQEIMKKVFNSKVSNEKAQTFYKVSKKDRDIHILGYYLNDNLVGTVTLNILTSPYGKEATIWNLAVKEECRRMGIATKLMNRAEEIAKSDKDILRIWLFSGFQRENAHKLYKKLGYDENRDKAFVKYIN